jgi:hypothetical protein
LGLAVAGTVAVIAADASTATTTATLVIASTIDRYQVCCRPLVS